MAERAVVVSKLAMGIFLVNTSELANSVRQGFDSLLPLTMQVGSATRSIRIPLAKQVGEWPNFDLSLLPLQTKECEKWKQ